MAENGQAKAKAFGLVGGVGGIVVAGASLLFQHVENAARNADIAIDVARQHGDELRVVNNAVDQLRRELVEVRAQIDLGGRFTRDDGDRLASRVDRVELQIDRLAEVLARNVPVRPKQ